MLEDYTKAVAKFCGVFVGGTVVIFLLLDWGTRLC